MKRLRTRMLPDTQSARVTKPRRRVIMLRRGMSVCMHWDETFRGTIVELGEEVSGIRIEGTKDIRYFCNHEFRAWKRDE